MNRQLRWMALLALPLCAMACSKPDASASTKSEAASEAKAEAFGKLTVEELEAKLTDAKAKKAALYVYDNNGKERFDKGHIPTAKWVDPSALKEGDLPADKSATLVFYCASENCMACHGGASAALKLGYKNVFILPAGIAGWEKAQKPTEKV